MKMINKKQKKTTGRKQAFKYLAISLAFIFGGLFFSEVASAASSNGMDLAGVSNQIKTNFKSLAELITAAAYIAGFGFAFAAILKFKAHKDNPTQIPVGTPIALLFIAAALIFLPSILTMGGKTVFGNNGKAGNIGGTDVVHGFKSDSN
jgi:intracellular multiplication protein IcmD